MRASDDVQAKAAGPGPDFPLYLQQICSKQYRSPCLALEANRWMRRIIHRECGNFSVPST
jgi:hypothetical protein